MNAIERSERRVKRLVVLKRIYEIEQKYCKVCPNRTSTELKYCNVCPVPQKLYELGTKLVSLSDRKSVEQIVDEPTVVKKKPGRKSKEEKDQTVGLTREVFLQERSNGLWVREIQHKYKMSRTALYHYLKKWGFRYLSQDQAKELLSKKEERAK